MEDLLREILAPSPTVQAATLPAGTVPSPSTTRRELQASLAPKAATPPLSAEGGDWHGEAEMQRLLDMLPSVQPDECADGFPAASDMELCGWEDVSALSSLTEVGVF